jgi:hypothetical protein
MTSLPSSAIALPSGATLGRIEPRLWTPPLRELTPETSYGFDVVEFARRDLARPLDPWQEWLAIHGGEMLPDGRPRFRIILVLVARQNGKTELLVVLSLFWQFVEAWPMILGTSTKLDYAKESWTKSVKLAEKCRALAPLRPARWKRETNGEQESWTTEESRYKIAASNEEGGRSLTINRLICDELRQHHSYDAWAACEPAASPMDAQIWALSNMGDDRAVVLNDYREEALEFVRWWDENGNEGVAELLLAGDASAVPGDFRLGIFEWSTPEGSRPDDLAALAMANPNMGRRRDPQVLLAGARRAIEKQGQALTKFQTEYMCLSVKNLNPAIDPTKWEACKVPGVLPRVRERIALVWDVSLDGEHATLTAAELLPDGKIRLEPLAAWTFGAAEHGMNVMIKELKEHVRLIRPARFGWLPVGPAATYAADLTAKDTDGKPTRPKWLPNGTRMEEIKGELPAVCMGFDEQVKAENILHSGDPLQDAHVLGAQKLQMGDRWVFVRRGGGHCDAAYSAAGAVHLARTMPPPQGRFIIK